MTPSLNLHQLRIFVTVAQSESFSRAADQLAMTQPAVSLQLKALETSLGLKLIERVGRRVSLTEAGEGIYARVLEMLRLEREAQEILGELRSAARGRVVVGANTTGGMYLVPEVIRAFRAHHPEIEVALRIETTDDICERIFQNVVHVGLAGGPITDRRLVSEPVVPDEVVPIVSPGHPLAQRLTIQPNDLLHQIVVVPEPRSRTRQLIDQLVLKNLGIPPGAVLSMTGTEAVKKAAEAGIGIGFVSVHSTSRETELGALRVLGWRGPRLIRSLELLRRRSRALPPAASLFLSFSREYFARRFDSPTTDAGSRAAAT